MNLGTESTILQSRIHFVEVIFQPTRNSMDHDPKRCVQWVLQCVRDLFRQMDDAANGRVQLVGIQSNFNFPFQHLDDFIFIVMDV
jgi:hypothetical protein